VDICLENRDCLVRKMKQRLPIAKKLVDQVSTSFKTYTRAYTRAETLLNLGGHVFMKIFTVHYLFAPFWDLL